MKKISLLLLTLLSLQACKKEEKTEGVLAGYTTKGVFIVNEGAFLKSNASISYRSDSGAVFNDIYKVVNGEALGDVAQSMAIGNDKVFIVVNNSQRIEVCNLSDFKKVATITGLGSPRFILPVSPVKAYATDWSNNTVKIIDLNSYQVTGSISCNSGPEQMVIAAGKLFVCNVGGFDKDSTITVIDTATNTAIHTLMCGINPNSMQVDKNGMLWVLCGGSLGDDYIGATADDRGGSLTCYNPNDYSVVKSFSMADSRHPLKLAMNGSGDVLYYLNGSGAYTGRIFKLGINAASLPNSAITERIFYGLGVDPLNEEVYGGVGNFNSNAYIFRYQSNGNLLDSAKVGVAPNSFVFNH